MTLTTAKSFNAPAKTFNAPAKTFNAPSGQELEQLTNFCKTLAQSHFYSKLGAAGVLAIYLTARELNLPFMSCINGGLYTFDGKVSMSAQLMNMMIVNAGHRADVLELNDKVCRIRFWRSDRKPGKGDVFEYEYTAEMAKEAGYLSKDVWKKHRRDMLFARCLSGGSRKFMPDVIMTCYVFGELDNDTSPPMPEDVGYDAAYAPIEEPPLPAEFGSSHIVSTVLLSTPPIPELSSFFQDNEKIKAFLSKYDIEDRGDSLGFAYIEEIATVSNKPIQTIIEKAAANETGFETEFNKWKAKRTQP